MQQRHARRARRDADLSRARAFRRRRRWLVTEQVVGAVLRGDLAKLAIDVVGEHRASAGERREIAERANVEGIEIAARIASRSLKSARVDGVNRNVAGTRPLDESRKHVIVAANRAAKLEGFNVVLWQVAAAAKPHNRLPPGWYHAEPIDNARQHAETVAAIFGGAEGFDRRRAFLDRRFSSTRCLETEGPLASARLLRDRFNRHRAIVGE